MTGDEKGSFSRCLWTGNALRHDLAAYRIRKINSSPSDRPSFESRNHHEDLRRFRKSKPHYNRFPPFRQQICEIFSNLKGPRTGPSLCKKQIIFPGIFCISRKWWSAPDSSETHHCPPRPAREHARSHGLHGSSARTKDRSYAAHPGRHPPRRTYTMFLVHHWPPISRSARPLSKKPDCDTPHSD